MAVPEFIINDIYRAQTSEGAANAPNIGVGAQSTLGGTTFLPEKICMKN